MTDKINDREMYMKGIDYSYYYEGYTMAVKGIQLMLRNFCLLKKMWHSGTIYLIK